VSENVTLTLVAVCASVAGVALGAYAYLSNKFQTKDDANKVETDLKTWIRKVETDVSKVQSSLELVGRDVSYIRGRLEPNNKSKED